MAKTALADVGNHVPELWAADLFAQAENLTFWSSFEGSEGSSMPIIRRDDLEKGVGDTIRMDIVLALTGAGQTGDTTALEGNEEALKFRQMQVTVDALSHGVRWTKLGKILINHDMRGVALNQLRKWLAGVLDDKIFAELVGTGATTLPTSAKFFAGANTAIAGIDTTDIPTLDEISSLKAYMQVNNKIEPIRLENGEEIFVLVLHPYAALSLKMADDWQAAQRDARERGVSNPLFTGALGMWDGVVIYSSNRIPTALDGTGSISVARNVFLGAQALSRAYAYYPDWTEEYFDYGREQGIATYLVYGQHLNAFDLSSAGGAAASAFTAIGSAVYYTAVSTPTPAT